MPGAHVPAPSRLLGRRGLGHRQDPRGGPCKGRGRVLGGDHGEGPWRVRQRLRGLVQRPGGHVPGDDPAGRDGVHRPLLRHGRGAGLEDAGGRRRWVPCPGVPGPLPRGRDTAEHKKEIDDKDTIR